MVSFINDPTVSKDLLEEARVPFAGHREQVHYRGKAGMGEM